MERYDVIVVGAGFGGATCAARLARRGLRVLLIEKNGRAGGKAMVIEKNGFTYELWPVIHAPARTSRCLEVIRELGLEGEVETLVPPVQGAIYIAPDGEVRRFPPGPDPDPQAVLEVLGVEPEERAHALALLAELATASDSDLTALEETSFASWLEARRPPRGLASYLHAICNGVFMVPSDLLAASEAIRTVRDILVGTGGLYCRHGGVGRLAELFATAVERFGGRVLYRTRVDRIRVEDGRVVGVVTGRGCFHAPVVVSNAGLQTTVFRLVGPEHFDRGYLNWARDLAPSWGMMGVRYFLSERVIDQPFQLVFSDRAYWTTPRWLEAAGRDPGEVILWVQVPANHEPSLAPEGRQCVLTGTWCPPDPELASEERERWWKCVDRMMERVWPGFLSRVEAREPYDTHDVSALSRDSALPGLGGECIGLGQVVGQCGRFKPSPQAPIAGLFYVGTDAGGSGCGTHQAVDSGIRVSDWVYRYSITRKALGARR